MNQIALALDSAPSFAREDFVIGEANLQAYEQLLRWPDWPDYALWLYGPAHAGKSHLASIWAQQAQAVLLTTRMLSEAESWLESPARAFWVDEIEALSPIMQTGLFHLLNHAREQRLHVLLISRHSPSQIPFSLPDLRSRIKALPTLMLDAPDDALLQALWFKLFADRQIKVTPAVIDYLQQRSERSFEAIHQIVEQLDHAALEQKREITIPFARSCLHTA